VPQTGQSGYDYNYEVMKWWVENFNGSDSKTGNSYKNHYAMSICFGLFFPLLIVAKIKARIKSTPARKKLWWFHLWTVFANLMPFICLIIGAHVAWSIKSKDHYNNPRVKHEYYAKDLKIVGIVKPGLDIIRIPHFSHPWGQFFVDVIPLTLISFMESYSVARRIAVQNNQLNLLSASQELWANGVANLLGSVGSAYPVSGSFSRSSLNNASGAKTPLSKVVTLMVVLLALGSLTRIFQYIPQAALAAVIWSSISNLVTVDDFWDAFRHSKKDFFLMVVTFAVTFIFDTSTGLAVGIGLSLITYLIETTFSSITAPLLVSAAKDNKGIDVVKLEVTPYYPYYPIVPAFPHLTLTQSCPLQGDLTFLSAARVKEFLNALTVQLEQPLVDSANTSDRLFKVVSDQFDNVLRPATRLIGVKELPKALVIDMRLVRLIDLSGVAAVAEVTADARQKGILVVITHAHEAVQRALAKMGVTNDGSTDTIDLDEYLYHKGALLPVVLSSTLAKPEAEVVDFNI
jgi:MFS superfamily sulfate permease-like transporter